MEEEQPWRDSSLTLADLAARLSTTPHKLSEVLNSQLGQSFYDFVNGYRVEEVKSRVLAGYQIGPEAAAARPLIVERLTG